MKNTIKLLEKNTKELEYYVKNFNDLGKIKEKKQRKYRLKKYGTYFFSILLTSFLTHSFCKWIDFNPFVRRITKEYENVMEITSSNGVKKISSSLDYPLKENTLITSTAWTLNDAGLYVRSVYEYDIHECNLEKYPNLVNLSSEELSQLFSLLDYSLIMKFTLSPKDAIYENELTTLTTYYKDEKKYHLKKESWMEYISFLILYYGFSWSGIPIGKYIFKKENSEATKEYIRMDKILEELAYHYPKTDKQELEDLLAIYEANKDLLDEQKILRK